MLISEKEKFTILEGLFGFEKSLAKLVTSLQKCFPTNGQYEIWKQKNVRQTKPYYRMKERW